MNLDQIKTVEELAPKIGTLIGTTSSISSTYYNVMRYGATGDGVTDDATAIQDCIDDMVDGTGIYFPTGNYHYTVVPSFLTLNNIHVFGEGTLKPSSCYGLSFDDCEDVIIDGLRFEATQAGNTYTGIELIPSTGNIRHAVQAVRGGQGSMSHHPRCRLTGKRYPV